MVIVTNDVKDSYNEILKSLKEKYSQMIFSRIDELRRRAYDTLSDVLDENLLCIFEETFELKERSKAQQDEFFKSEDYVKTQERLVDLKERVSACEDETEKAELSKQLSKVMDRVSTLNVTINNRLKKYTDKINANVEIMKRLVNSDGGLFNKVKTDFLNEINDIIKDGITDFNEELKPIKEQFGKDTEELEFPFDENTVRVQIELFPSEIEDVYGKSDSEFVPSKNENTIKN